jgi:hypothetical protein
MASYGDCTTSTAMGANGVTHSYRRMGISNGAQPLVLLQHFVILRLAEQQFAGARDRGSARR